MVSHICLICFLYKIILFCSVIEKEWFEESLPTNCFDKSRTKLIKALQFTLDDILMLQENYESYSFFFDRFVLLLEKKTSFQRKIKTATQDEELLTIRSEAFGLLLLENYWLRWLDISQKSGGRVSIRGCSKRKESLSQIQPKYTRVD